VPALRSEPLTLFFKALTQLGSTWFLFSFLALGFAFWRRYTCARLAVLNVLTVIVNSYLKAVYMLPRPDPSLHMVDFSSWSFPSGHAQHAAVTWVWLAWEIGKPWSWIAGALLTLGIASSRIYLGVHYGRDVVAGLLVGGVSLLCFRWLLTGSIPVRLRLRQPAPLFSLLVVQFAWLALLHDTTRIGFLPVVAVLGFWAGLLGKRRWRGLEGLGWGWCLLISVAVLLPCFLAIHAGSSPSTGQTSLTLTSSAIYLQIATLGLWASLIAPELLGKLRLER
jgi:membrane-associated phospholipid phosphatase